MFPGVNGEVCPMVFTIYGNSEHVAHAWRKIGLFGFKNLKKIFNCSQSIQLP